MPGKISPAEQPDFSDLKPEQVKVTSFIEIGSKFQGKIPGGLVGSCEHCQGCESCDHCQTCESCQTCQCESDLDLHLAHDLGIDGLVNKPLKFAVNVIYEPIKATAKRQSGSALKQTNVIIEMSEEAFTAIPGKKNFIEVGSSKRGEKQYLWKGKN